MVGTTGSSPQAQEASGQPMAGLLPFLFLLPPEHEHGRSLWPPVLPPPSFTSSLFIPDSSARPDSRPVLLILALRVLGLRQGSPQVGEAVVPRRLSSDLLKTHPELFSGSILMTTVFSIIVQWGQWFCETLPPLDVLLCSLWGQGRGPYLSLSLLFPRPLAAVHVGRASTTHSPCGSLLRQALGLNMNECFMTSTSIQLAQNGRSPGNL